VGSNSIEGMDVYLLCVLLGRGLCDELITRPEEPKDCGVSLCVITKPREQAGRTAVCIHPAVYCIDKLSIFLR
jgi:hypothetical protein